MLLFFDLPVRLAFLALDATRDADAGLATLEFAAGEDVEVCEEDLVLDPVLLAAVVAEEREVEVEATMVQQDQGNSWPLRASRCAK